MYKKFGSKLFSYIKKNGKQVSMSYWEVPAGITENHEKFAQLFTRALMAANRVNK